MNIWHIHIFRQSINLNDQLFLLEGHLKDANDRLMEADISRESLIAEVGQLPLFVTQSGLTGFLPSCIARFRAIFFKEKLAIKKATILLKH